MKPLSATTGLVWSLTRNDGLNWSVTLILILLWLHIFKNLFIYILFSFLVQILSLYGCFKRQSHSSDLSTFLPGTGINPSAPADSALICTCLRQRGLVQIRHAPPGIIIWKHGNISMVYPISTSLITQYGKTTTTESFLVLLQ